MKHKHLLIAICCIPVLVGCGIGNKVIKQTTDERGLTSVVYTTAHNDMFALDYLTRREYKRMFKKPVTKPIMRYSVNCTNDTIFYGN